MSSTQLKKVITLPGPTACGKTDIAIVLAKQFPIEIISVDSALIYRDMNIGTAKPDKATLAEIPHHLVDIRNPNETYSAADFCQDAYHHIDAILQRGNIPLLVGGTMLYFKTLLYGIAELPQANAAIREKIQQDAAQCGWQTLHEKLAMVDPTSATKIHPNDPQRIQRALEVFMLTGNTLSSYQQSQSKHVFPYECLQVLLMPTERAYLHERIKVRFMEMLSMGFVEEVQALRNQWTIDLDRPAIRSVGYRQVWEYLDGKTDYDTMVAKGIAATRQLAKRQITWLRTWCDGVVFPVESTDLEQDLRHLVEQFLTEKN